MVERFVAAVFHMLVVVYLITAVSEPIDWFELAVIAGFLAVLTYAEEINKERN